MKDLLRPVSWFMILFIALLISCSRVSPQQFNSARMDPISIAKDGRGFILTPSGKPFVPWGLNYGNRGRLIEDYWESEWQTVVDDFREMKAVGANVVRVHLQFGKFTKSPEKADESALRQLGRLVELAEQTGLYLDLTGLGCYRKADIPAWYDVLSERERWSTQARFWEAVATQCSHSPAIFCYDLMNEPLAPAGKRKPREWYSGTLFGGYDFLQWIALDQGNRARDEIACRWIDTLTKAIRRHDLQHLITVGLLPSSPQLGHFSGFLPEKVAPHLDFISVHIYPENGKVEQALKTLHEFSAGKPVVIEETFPLSCGRDELEVFLRASRGIACGWMGHYDGQSPEELEQLKQQNKITIPQAIYLDWLQLFQKLKPEMLVK
jgi:hypothetical protein